MATVTFMFPFFDQLEAANFFRYSYGTETQLVVKSDWVDLMRKEGYRYGSEHESTEPYFQDTCIECLKEAIRMSYPDAVFDEDLLMEQFVKIFPYDD
jgi:hypothetical protein